MKNYPNISKEEIDKYNIFIDEINKDNNQDIAKLFIDPNTKEKLIYALKNSLKPSEKLLFLDTLLQNNYELLEDDRGFLEDIVYDAFKYRSFYNLVDFFKDRSENVLRFALEIYKDNYSYKYMYYGEEKLPQSKMFKSFNPLTLKLYKNTLKVILDEAIKAYTHYTDTPKPTIVPVENDGYLTEQDLKDYKELLGFDLDYYIVTFSNGDYYFNYLEK